MTTTTPSSHRAVRCTVIENKNCQSSFQDLEPALHRLLKKEYVGSPTVRKDAFPKGWALFVQTNCLSVGLMTRRGLRIPSARQALFVPPFQLVEWHIPQGQSSFEVYYSGAGIEKMPGEPMLVDLPPDFNRYTLKAIVDFVLAEKRSSAIVTTPRVS